MPIRQGISITQTIVIEQSNLVSSCRSRVFALLVFGAIAWSLTVAAFAQETPKPPQTPTEPSSAGQPRSAPSKVPGAGLYNLLQEKSVVFPDIASSTERLSSGQKFQLFVDNSISLNALATAAAGSAISQADNSPTGFGQGWDAYAKRFGSSMGRQASSEFFGTFMLASVLHQDPRFYPEANPSFGQAVKYSVQRIFVTRNDDGRDVANWSGLVGPAMAEGLANVYWPERNRTVGDTLMRYGLDIATRAGGNLLREYWPVFYGKVRHAPRPTAGHN
jgi:hypothetical protein